MGPDDDSHLLAVESDAERRSRYSWILTVCNGQSWAMASVGMYPRATPRLRAAFQRRSPTDVLSAQQGRGLAGGEESEDSKSEKTDKYSMSGHDRLLQAGQSSRNASEFTLVGPQPFLAPANIITLCLGPEQTRTKIPVRGASLQHGQCICATW